MSAPPAFRVTIVLALLIAVGEPGKAGAQQTGDISVRFGASAPSFDHQPAMVSLVRDGRVVEQGETALRADRGFTRLEPGTYDVRVECDGAVTEVKRGVQVFAGRVLTLEFALRPGKGVHVVEYATGGLSREEVAAHLQRLDAAVDSLRHAVQTGVH
jgi:hypothetical protein